MNLYNKYRSNKFSEVVGQEHIVRIITNSIKNNKLGHAYLFSGPRGTGKTTIARLLSKSLNCMERSEKDFEPCNKCFSCKEINLGTSMDIIEIDAASNRGIDDIRALREKIGFAPSGKKFKVFIIDEVHMLTREAFNALLKTLEEPPKHAVFIMATTEINKVPDTIISRSLQFDFQLHQIININKRLHEIVKKENINIDDESLLIISHYAKGGLRDAITLLDQISSMDGKIDAKLTRKILGLGSFKSIINFWKFLAFLDFSSILELLNKLSEEGVNLLDYCDELLEFGRQMLIYKSGYKKSLANYSKEEKDEIIEVSSKIEKDKLVLIIEKLIKAHINMKLTNLINLPLEIVAFEIIGGDKKIEIKNKVSNDNKNDEKKDKFETVKKIIIQDKKEISSVRLIQKKEEKFKETKIEKTISYTKNTNLDISEIENRWKSFTRIIAASNQSIAILLKESIPSKFEDDNLVIKVQFKFYKDRLEGRKMYETLCSIIEQFYKYPIIPKFIVDESMVKKITEYNLDSKSSDGGLVSDALEVFNS